MDDREALREATEYFENEAAEWRMVERASAQGAKIASAREEAERFERYAAAIRALPEGERIEGWANTLPGRLMFYVGNAGDSADPRYPEIKRATLLIHPPTSGESDGRTIP